MKYSESHSEVTLSYSLNLCNIFLPKMNKKVIIGVDISLKKKCYRFLFMYYYFQRWIFIDCIACMEIIDLVARRLCWSRSVHPFETLSHWNPLTLIFSIVVDVDLDKVSIEGQGWKVIFTCIGVAVWCLYLALRSRPNVKQHSQGQTAIDDKQKAKYDHCLSYLPIRKQGSYLDYLVDIWSINFKLKKIW